MAISVSQELTLGTWSGSLVAAAGAGDTLIYVVTAYTTSGSTISSSSPVYGGSTPTGTIQLAATQSSGTNAVYTAIWMLPHITGGSTAVSITVSGQVTPSDTHTVGLTVIDITGLGSNPALDKSSTSIGGGTAVTSGATGSITAAPEIVIGSLVGFGMVMNEVGAPWTETQLSDEFQLTGYQLAASSGVGYTYAQTATNGASWAGAIATIKSGASSAPSGLLMAGIV